MVVVLTVVKYRVGNMVLDSAVYIAAEDGDAAGSGAVLNSDVPRCTALYRAALVVYVLCVSARKCMYSIISTCLARLAPRHQPSMLQRA